MLAGVRQYLARFVDAESLPRNTLRLDEVDLIIGYEENP